MTETIAEIAARWDLTGYAPFGGEPYNEIHERIVFQRRFHYDQYVPTLLPDQISDFEARIEKWLEKVPVEADRRTLFEFIPQIIFYGRDEFNKLHQTALSGPITQWMIAQLAVSFDDPQLNSKLSNEIYQNTWFCAVSDSMQISDFHHANHIGGIDYRPDFRTLSMFGDIAKVFSFIRDRRDANDIPRPIRRVVLLEDFIGSGAQLQDAFPAIQALVGNGIPILLVPLIICPEGAALARRFAANNPNLYFDPVLEIKPDATINPQTPATANALTLAIKELATRLFPLVRGNGAAYPRPYEPYGFRNTGALVVLYSNTPANTLPLIQHPSDSWAPIFPRSARVK